MINLPERTLSANVSPGATCASGNNRIPSGCSDVSSKRIVPQRKHSIVQTILEWFDSDPTVALSTADVAIKVYGFPGFKDVQKKHRVAVIRAMQNVCTKRPSLRVHRGEGPEGQAVIFNSHNIQSYAMCRMKTDWLNHYQWTRQPWTRSEQKLREMLNTPREQQYVVEGGSWFNHVEQWKAADAGDRRTWLTLEIDQLRRIIACGAALGAVMDRQRKELDQAVAEISAMEVAT